MGERVQLRALPGVGQPLVYAQPTLLEVVSAVVDSDRAGIGSSGWVGDWSSNFLVLPQVPSTQRTRYFGRLCGLWVPGGCTARLRGFRQAVYLSANIRVTGPDQNPALFTAILEQTTPAWTFSDANFAFHLRFVHGRFLRTTSVDVANPQAPGTSPNPYGTDTALLYELPSLSPYAPAFGGVPPGRALGGLGTIRSLLEPWWRAGNVAGYDYAVEGPGTLAMYFSLKQTDPSHRVVLASSPDPGALSPEDRFLLAYPQATYHSIGGAIIAEISPSQAKHNLAEEPA